MSKSYTKKNDTFIYALFAIVFIFVLTPVIPLFLTFVILIYIAKAQGKYMAIISVVLLILEIIIKSNTISIFINEMSYILSVIVSNLAQAEFTSLSIYLNYSLSSWLLIINMSFFLASLYKMRIERQAKLENIGVKEMHKEIKDLQKEAENNKSIENKKNGVFIGIDEATKKQVYSNYNSKHILVGGTTGSGKTTLLANYILDAVKNNYGYCRWQRRYRREKHIGYNKKIL